jgi:hypothetical protein
VGSTHPDAEQSHQDRTPQAPTRSTRSNGGSGLSDEGACRPA